jgi:hypothetical protein
MKHILHNSWKWVREEPKLAAWLALVIGCILWVIFSAPKSPLTPEQEQDANNYLNSQGRGGY